MGGGFGSFNSGPAPQNMGNSGFSSFQSAAAPSQPKPSGNGIYAGGLVDLSNLGGSNTGGQKTGGQFGGSQGGFGSFSGSGPQQQQKSNNDAFANICNF